jgi:geranylgeranylglycerol-phosphate geranylgeranyltransferase
MTPFAAPDHKPSFFGSVVAYFRLWRYQANAVIVCFISMYLGWLMLAGGFHLPQAALRVVAATAAATCLLLATFLINDVADRDIDKIVHPDRPIPRGLARATHIFLFGAFLLAAGMALALIVSVRFFMVAALLAALLALYYGFLKRRLRAPFFSDIVTPVMSALFPVSAFAASPQFSIEIMLSVVTFIYFADLAHDLIGGVHDRAGDRQHNVSTVALAIGSRPALWISFAAFLLSVAAGGLVYIQGELGWLYLAALGIMSATMSYHYARSLRATDRDVAQVAGKTNHIGGFYFFIVSAAILPDYLIRQWLG